MQLDDRIGRRLKLRDLNIFLAVVKEGGMSKAAAVLAISQPAISKSIADMEHALGAPLLDRTPQGVEPTHYGQALLKRGLAVFDELRQSVNDIQTLLDPTVGEVRIGCTSPLAAGIVAAVIGKLSDQHPRISYQVLEGDIAMLQRDVADRKIEFAIGRAHGSITDENMESEILFNDRLLVVSGPRSKWLRRKESIQLAELLSERWIFPPAGTIAASLIADSFRAAGAPCPQATVSSNSARLNNNLLASGRFLTVFPESMMRWSGAHVPLKVLPVDMPSPRRPVILIRLKNRTLSPAAQLFIEHARKLVEPLAKKKA